MLKLVSPALILEQDCKEYIIEHYNNGERNISGDGGLSQFKLFEKWIKNREDFIKGVNIPKNLVPSSTFLVYDETLLVGMIDIRHNLNEQLIILGGHIGYGVRPSERGKGYGKKMLKLALDYSKDYLGLDKVLVSCDKDNEPSRKVIISNGGVFENELFSERLNRVTQRFWIQI